MEMMAKRIGVLHQAVIRTMAKTSGVLERRVIRRMTKAVGMVLHKAVTKPSIGQLSTMTLGKRVIAQYIDRYYEGGDE